MKNVFVLVAFAVGALLGGGAGWFAAKGQGPSTAAEPAKGGAESVCAATTPIPGLSLDDPATLQKVDDGMRTIGPDVQRSWRDCLSERTRTCALDAAVTAAARAGTDDPCLLLPSDQAKTCTVQAYSRLARDKGDPAICERLRETPGYEQCKREALQHRRVDADFGITCDTLASPDDRAACHVRIFAARAKREGRLAACLDLPALPQRAGCLYELNHWVVELGAERGAAVCEGFPSEGGLLDRCLRMALQVPASRSGDPKICQRISDADMRRDCEDDALAGRASNLRSLAACDDVRVEPRREECRRVVNQRLMNGNDSASSCLQLPEGPERTRCTDEALHRQAVSTRDPTPCEGLSDPAARARCVEEIGVMARRPPPDQIDPSMRAPAGPIPQPDTPAAP